MPQYVCVFAACTCGCMHALVCVHVHGEKVVNDEFNLKMGTYNW